MSKLTDVIKQIENNSITELNLYNNKIGDEGAKALASALEGDNSITALDLRFNGIGAKGAKALAKALASAFEGNNSITALDLRFNKIGDEGVKALAPAFKGNNSITELYLSCNKIGDEGAKALASALEGNHSVTQLNFSYNNIGDESIKETLAQIVARNIKNQNDSKIFAQKYFAENSIDNKFTTFEEDFMKSLKIFQLTPLYNSSSEDSPMYVKNVKLFMQDEWPLLLRICKSVSEESLLSFLPQEVMSFIGSFLGNKSLHCLKPVLSAKNSIASVESKDIPKMVDDIVKLYTESRSQVDDDNQEFHSGSHIETTSIVELVPELIGRNVFDDDLNSTCINQ